MGNFKHHSIRPGDRDRDRERDGDKDRERDIRDKEGQDRLRHVRIRTLLPVIKLTFSHQLSEKYDRDMLSLPPTGLRNKERDAAPHLAPAPASRSSAQAQVAPINGHRIESREISKKKAGETSEDWRRGMPTIS